MPARSYPFCLWIGDDRQNRGFRSFLPRCRLSNDDAPSRRKCELTPGGTRPTLQVSLDKGRERLELAFTTLSGARRRPLAWLIYPCVDLRSTHLCRPTATRACARAHTALNTSSALPASARSRRAPPRYTPAARRVTTAQQHIATSQACTSRRGTTAPCASRSMAVGR